ncbi:GAF domain-containing protein [Allorhizobium sp. BGMRC 0089]|uniref:HWE histidine kinase domain-containing protein n=1 Tax=Allorhizobium sonneratiae TaxID=2934936 RepID=UPI00203458AF|nr:HWE histidine kinase domain-containing protein [Allorhizobium sonneratiae]MCM2291012.1 GAF domain-containing protein [Allorhizobium sonneratiae]
MSPPQPVDLSNCDREPIHIPGSIQPHGCLLVTDAAMTTILRHSANAAAFLGIEDGLAGHTLAGQTLAGQTLAGKSLADLLGAAVTHDLRNALSLSSNPTRSGVVTHTTLASGEVCDIAVHSHNGVVIVELEPSKGSLQPLLMAREMIGRIKDINDVDHLIASTAKLVRAVLGYDRVMIYRLEHDGAGKVVAEARRGDLESFLGQYFPASDIPEQARRLYLQNPIRVISDARGARVPLVPVDDEAKEPIDLSFAHLRSVSPIHLEYLRNMGVAASMSISVLNNDALWGLIACHHYEPKTLSLTERMAAELFGEFFSLHLLALKQKRKLELANDARRSLDRFLHQSAHYANLEELFTASLPEFRQLFACEGLGLWMNGVWTASGSVPPDEAVEPLLRFIPSVADGRIWSTHQLSRDFAPATAYVEAVSGVMAIPLSQIPNDYLLVFRKERLQTLNWAGNPEKSYETGPLGDRLTPRKSFSIWKETVRCEAEAWSDSDLDIAEAMRAVTVEIILRHNELMQEERAKADLRQRLLNEELNHRVKNILSVIKSLVGVPSAPSDSIVDYVTTLKGRIQALAFAHDQVIRGSGTGLITDLLEAELSPYRSENTMITLDGPLMVLESRAYAVTALVIHELSTNAAKYGALSRPGGQLSVTWAWTETNDCAIIWAERGGPPVKPPGRRGFGSALIERSIPYDLSGKSSLHYDADGLTAELLIPGRFISGKPMEKHLQSQKPVPRPPQMQARPLDVSGTVLIVEDQMLIAMDAEMMLNDAGFSDVITARSAAEALHKLGPRRPTVAIVDINLGDHTSLPVAEELYRRGIPFVFATGYAERNTIPPHFSAIAIVNKPYDPSSLIGAIKTALNEKA